MKSNNKGFTLVELSIVIVIVGLIIAGVSAGQTLVKQAQLRSILTEADQIKTAVNTFKSQYGGLPGDIINGSTYWSTGCVASAASTSSTASVAGDCNGDGDKQIDTGAKSTAANSREIYIAWVHLNKAGLIPGSFTPGAGNATAGNVGAPGTNMPNAKFPKAGISLGYDASAMLSSTNTSAKARNLVVFGKSSTSIANGAFLTPPQAASLDTKADDGDALKGSVLAGTTDAGTMAATTGTCSNSSSYNLSLTTALCSLGFVL